MVSHIFITGKLLNTVTLHPTRFHRGTSVCKTWNSSETHSHTTAVKGIWVNVIS